MLFKKARKEWQRSQPAPFRSPSECTAQSDPILRPVHWDREFRCFVLHGDVATISVYSRNHDLAQSADGDFPFTDDEFDAAKSFCELVVGAYASATPAAVVVDVGQISGRGWAVIEANAANSSGFYGCDPAQVLKVLRAAVLPSV